MNLVFLVALLLQNGDYAPAMKAVADTQNREAQLRQVASLAKRAVPSAAEENRKAYTAGHDEEFVGKFNSLINKLMEFADSYKDGKTLDVKKARAVRKAWLELEKSEAIFQDPNRK
jgi:hypothetical protein